VSNLQCSLDNYLERLSCKAYLDLTSLEGQFQLVRREYEKAQYHDEKVQLARIAKEIATEYRKRVTGYRQTLKPKSPAAPMDPLGPVRQAVNEFLLKRRKRRVQGVRLDVILVA
jgi:hypothetical protein